VVTSNPVFLIVGDLLCPIAEISPSIAYSSSSTGRSISEEKNIMKNILKGNGVLVLAEGVGRANDD
jgi:hypothetical protein